MRGPLQDWHANLLGNSPGRNLISEQLQRFDAWPDESNTSVQQRFRKIGILR